MPSSAERRHWQRRIKRADARIRRQVAAGKLVITMDMSCRYPLCFEPRVTDDCCYKHSIDSHNGSQSFLVNDGIIDWQAIEVARRGERVVGLTWVEYEIAGAMILMDGETQEEMRERTGITCRSSGTRIERMKELADALASV